jgi:predicted metal-binding protein
MKIQRMQMLFMFFKNCVVARAAKTRMSYVFFDFKSFLCDIVHRLSTDYINIWYA